MRAGSLVLAVALWTPAAALAQAPEAQAPPVFGVGVDVVAIDASVVDQDGRPILGLGPEDFRVDVDGRPRRLVSVEYVGRDLEPAAPPQARPVHFSSNEGLPKGRLVLLLVDRGNIGRGGGRQVFKAAEHFLDGLAPADRVGLAFIPGPGSSIEFTGDVEQVRQGLKGVVGLAPRAGHRVPLAEALARAKGNDPMRWEQFVTLTCTGSLPSGASPSEMVGEDGIVPFSVARVANCQRDLEIDALQVYQEYRQRSLATQGALRATLESLQSIEGPKTLVLISEGLGNESVSEIRDLAVAASRAQVTLFVVLLDTSSSDASVAFSAIASQEDREIEAGGLYDLAAQARGAVLRVVGSGEAAFQRIARELMGYYLLGFEPEAGDRDGRGHTVRVEVSRPKATVRARGLLAIPAAAPTPRQVLAATLRSPLVERSLPVAVATYALHDATSGKTRVLIAARMKGASRPVSVGFALFSAGGKVAASRAYEGITGGEGEWVDFTAEAVVDPDTYSLRLAAVDAAGRRGSVEHTAKAALVTAGGLQISDLVLAPASRGRALRPAVDLEVGSSGLSASVDLASRDASRLAGATVAIELAEAADGPALLRVPVNVGQAEPGGTRNASVEIAPGILPPGEYTVRAEVSVEGRPVAVVARPFHVVPVPEGQSPVRSPLTSLLVEASPFDRAKLLKPEVLGHFVDDALSTVPGPAPARVAAATEKARQGRPEAMLDDLGTASKADPRAAFLRGVSLYARGNLPAAVTQLQEALRLNSELFPAAVFIGACHAASGQDLDAIGAWQTGLLGGSGSPALYELLGDALMRVKEERQAVEILTEGLTSFPEDAGLRRQLGIARAMAGDREEALPLLTDWVEAHPDDDGARLATLALLFEGFARETAGAAPAEETQRLMRFARAYVDGKKPNREVVACWLRYLESRTRG